MNWPEAFTVTSVAWAGTATYITHAVVKYKKGKDQY